MQRIYALTFVLIAGCSAQRQPDPKTAGELVDYILAVLCGSATNPGEACAARYDAIKPLLDQRRAAMAAPLPRDAGVE